MNVDTTEFQALRDDVAAVTAQAAATAGVVSTLAGDLDILLGVLRQFGAHELARPGGHELLRQTLRAVDGGRPAAKPARARRRHRLTVIEGGERW